MFLCAFSIFSLSLVLRLDYDVSWHDFLWACLVRVYSASRIYRLTPFCQFGDFLAIVFSAPSPLSTPSDPNDMKVRSLIVVLQGPKTLPFFSLFYSVEMVQFLLFCLQVH